MILGRAGLRSERGYGGNGHNANGLPLTGYGGNGPAVAPVLANGHRLAPAEGQQSLFSWAVFMAEEPVKSKVRSRVPVRVGADCGTGAGDRAGRRGALDRNTQGEEHRDSVRYPSTARLCMGIFCCLFSGGALIPLLRPPLRQMVHLGKRQALKPIRGDSLWIWPPPFNVG